MRFRNFIFDLDGTLIDSISGIEHSLQAAAALLLPDKQKPDIRGLIGPPLRIMLGKMWPDVSPEDLSGLISEFREHYDRQGCLLSIPYAGAGELLQKLKKQGANLYLLTNKPYLPTCRILESVGWTSLFSAVYSPDMPTSPFSSKELGAKHLVERFLLRVDESCLIGDSIEDAAAAGICGLPFYAITYGYGNAGECGHSCEERIKSLSQLEEILLKQ